MVISLTHLGRTNFYRIIASFRLACGHVRVAFSLLWIDVEGPRVLWVVRGGMEKAKEHKSEARQWAVLLHDLSSALALSLPALASLHNIS